MEAASELDPAPPKRPKTLDKGKEKMEEPETTASVEASAAAEMDEEEEEEATCGICLSDAGRSIRGRIDSCDHYFCFVCILEWAKIESRCPLCKRRFRSICRPPVPGIFLVERIVDVPLRDQVYHPLGNESTSFSDPYAHVSCCVCHNSQNEELLLLCDLCDSSAHTYCVGFGATVPEGDWYCSDCTISRDRHSKAQLDDDSLPQDACKDDGVLQVPEQLISISDIVSDEVPSTSSRKSSNLNVLRTKRTCRKLQSRSVSRPRTEDSGIKQSSIVPTVGEPLGNLENNIESGARTLRNCRNLHDRIQSLRSNWNSIRSGSLRFSSSVSSVPTGTSSNTARQQDTTSHVKQEDATPSSICSKTMTDSPDIDKAWEMLKIAKTAQAAKRDSKSDDFLNSRGKKNATMNATGYPSKSNVHNIAEKLQLLSNACKGKTPVGNRACINRTEDQYNQRCNAQGILRQTPDADKRTELQNFQGPNRNGTLPPQTFLCQTPWFPCSSRASPNYSCSADCSQSGVSTRSSKKLSNISPSKVEAHNKFSIGSQTYTGLTLSKKAKRNVSDKSESLANRTEIQNFEGPTWKGDLPSLCQTFSGSQESLDDPASAACSQNVFSTPPYKKLSIITPNVEVKTKVGIGSDINASFISGNDEAKRNLRVKSESLDKQTEVGEFQGKDALPSQIPHVCGSSMKTSASSDNSPKGEIQSLVKLNLKLLNKDKQLEAVTFKQIARTATHTILAACGLEHSKSCARSFSASICGHSDEIKQLRKSDLLPNSCRECFYTFVQNVVNSVLSEKRLVRTQPD